MSAKARRAEWKIIRHERAPVATSLREPSLAGRLLPADSHNGTWSGRDEMLSDAPHEQL